MTELEELLIGEIWTPKVKIYEKSVVKAVSDQGREHHWQVDKIGKEKVILSANYKIQGENFEVSKELDRREFVNELRYGCLQKEQSYVEIVDGVLVGNQLQNKVKQND